MSFAKGARRSHPAKLARARMAPEHPAIAAVLAAALPASASLMADVPDRLDQGQTSTCTAHSFAAAVATACARKGQPLGFVPSPKNEYACTHALERAAATPAGQPLAPFTDNGAELADAIEAGSVFGVCAMRGPTSDGRNSDVDPETAVAEPDVDALEQAATSLVTGEYRIDPAASNVSDQVAAAIAAGFPVYTAFFVDGAFEALGPNDVAQPPNENDPNGGGHAVFLAGYRTNAAGKREFLLVNSWSASWCDNGCCWCSEAWLRACWELYVVDVKVGPRAA